MKDYSTYKPSSTTPQQQTNPATSTHSTPAKFLPPPPENISNRQPVPPPPERELRITRQPPTPPSQHHSQHSTAAWSLTIPGDEAHVEIDPPGVNRGIFTGDGWTAGRDSLGDWYTGEAGFMIAAATATSYEPVHEPAPTMTPATTPPQQERKNQNG